MTQNMNGDQESNNSYLNVYESFQGPCIGLRSDSFLDVEQDFHDSYSRNSFLNLLPPLPPKLLTSLATGEQPQNMQNIMRPNSTKKKCKKVDLQNIPNHQSRYIPQLFGNNVKEQLFKQAFMRKEFRNLSHDSQHYKGIVKKLEEAGDNLSSCIRQSQLAIRCGFSQYLITAYIRKQIKDDYSPQNQFLEQLYGSFKNIQADDQDFEIQFKWLRHYSKYFRINLLNKAILGIQEDYGWFDCMQKLKNQYDPSFSQVLKSFFILLKKQRSPRNQEVIRSKFIQKFKQLYNQMLISILQKVNFRRISKEIKFGQKKLISQQRTVKRLAGKTYRILRTIQKKDIQNKAQQQKEAIQMAQMTAITMILSQILSIRAHSNAKCQIDNAVQVKIKGKYRIFKNPRKWIQKGTERFEENFEDYFSFSRYQSLKPQNL